MKTFTVLVYPKRLPSLNEYVSASKRKRGRDNAGNLMKRSAQWEIMRHIQREYKGMIISEPCKVHFVYYEKNQKRDPDNISAVAHKFILDALVLDKVIKDDSMKYIKGITDTWHVDALRPRIEVSIEICSGDPDCDRVKEKGSGNIQIDTKKKGKAGKKQ